MLKAIIADDDAVFREYLKTCIRWSDMGVEVAACVGNGAEALDRAMALRPDILVLDVEMPDTDGLSCARQIKRELPNSVIVLITGYERFQYAKETAKLGIRDILLKPVDKEEVEQILSRALREHGMQRIADSVMHLVLEKQQKNAYLSLLDHECPDNHTLGLCRLIVSAVQGGEVAQIYSSVEQYVQEIRRWNGLPNSSLWLYALPALICIDLLPEDIHTFDREQLCQRIRTAQQNGDVEQVLYGVCLRTEAVIRRGCGSRASRNAEAAMVLIRQHYPDPEFSIAKLAQMMFLHEGYLRRIFQAAYGKAPHTVLTEVRMNAAKELLAQGNIQVQQAAQMVGFEDASYFSKCFKQFFGYPPRKTSPKHII